jgi:hypothetical protein
LQEVMAALFQFRSERAGGVLALLLAASCLSPLFGKASATRHGRPTPSAVIGAADPQPTPTPDTPHPCSYVVSSWVHAQDKSEDQAAQDRLMEKINALLPDPNTVRATTQRLWRALREVAVKPKKQKSQDHYDFVSVTETLDVNTGRMTVEISVSSIPQIPKHDFRLGPGTPIKIEGCKLPARSGKGERSCQDQEITDIAEKIKAHDREHDQGKYETH